MAPSTTSTDNPGAAPADGTTRGISNRPSASLAADNEDEEADHGTTMLAADVELSRNRRTFLQYLSFVMVFLHVRLHRI